MKFAAMVGGAVAALASPPAAWAVEAQDPGQAILQGSPILEMRLRYEGVDQQGLARKAEALTLRTRAGWRTGRWRGLEAAVDIDDVRPIAREAYNIAVPGVAGGSLNGRTRFPAINDPAVTELNRAQLVWSPATAFRATVGRQRIVIEDQRFVGNVPWRQDEQTFDAVRLEYARGPVSLGYAYVDRVNRTLGDERDWRSDSHLIDAGYSFGSRLRVHGFAYLLDFGNAPLASSQTYGLKAMGAAPAAGMKIAYDATWATQAEYGNSPDRFDLGYRAATWRPAGRSGPSRPATSCWRATASAASSFRWRARTPSRAGRTPSPPSGRQDLRGRLRDLNLQLTARPHLKAAHLSNVELIARYHDFNADRTGADLGHEWNLQATAAVARRVNALVKFARFERASFTPPGAATPPATRTKLWFSLEYKL